MFIRPCYRTVARKRHAYWALVESVRTPRGPRQRVVAYLGQMDESGRLGVQEAARRHPGQQGRLDNQVAARWVTIDAHRVRVERCLELGGPWLGLELMRKLGLTEFLQSTLPPGQEQVPWSLMAMILVLCRLCRPSSELYIAGHYYRQTAMADLLGVPVDRVNDDRLYRALDQLLAYKEQLEVHLKNRLGELFDLQYYLLLYDVTSTYFEGLAEGNALAQRGYWRDHPGAPGLQAGVHRLGGQQRRTAGRASRFAAAASPGRATTRRSCSSAWGWPCRPAWTLPTKREGDVVKISWRS